MINEALVSKLTTAACIVFLAVTGLACGGSVEKKVEVDPAVTQQQGSEMEQLMQRQAEMLQRSRPNQQGEEQPAPAE